MNYVRNIHYSAQRSELVLAIRTHTSEQLRFSQAMLLRHSRLVSSGSASLVVSILIDIRWPVQPMPLAEGLLEDE